MQNENTKRIALSVNVTVLGTVDAEQPIGEFEGYIDGIVPTVKWVKDRMPKVGDKLYVAPPSTAAVRAAEWISVEDRLPEVETDVLVRGKRGESVCHEVAGLFNGEWMGQNSELELRFIVTHWTPLPAAPGVSTSPAAEAVGEVERDAARYRWLLDHYACGDGYIEIDAALNDGEADKYLSPAIDAAMAQSTDGGNGGGHG